MAVFNRNMQELDTNDAPGSLRLIARFIAYMMESIEHRNAVIEKRLKALEQKKEDTNDGV